MKASHRLMFLILLSFPLRAGWSAVTGDVRRSHLSANYAQGLNFERWQGVASINRMLWNKKIIMDEQITVWMHDVKGYHAQWKFDQKLNFELHTPINESTEWLLIGDFERFLDRRADRIEDEELRSPLTPDNSEYSPYLSNPTVGGNSLIKGHLGLGSTYRLSDEATLKGTVGKLYENRSERKCEGLRLIVDLDIVDSNTQLQANGWRDHLSDGSDFGWSGVYSGYYLFSDQADDQFNIAYSHKDRRQQYYSEGVSNRRSDESIQITNKLTSGNRTMFPMSWDSELSRERTDHRGLQGDFTDLSFAWDNDIVLEWKDNPMLSGSVAGGVNIQQQQYARQLNQGRRTHLRFRADFIPSKTDSISLESRASRYRFDTPDEADGNDRDELRYVVTLQYWKSIMPQFGARIKLETDLNHLVYIYQPRSIENRWMRLFKLSAELPWNENRFDNNARFAVVSHFSDYDYSPATESQSRVYRTFTAEDSLNIRLRRNLILEADVALKIDDHGRFNWSDWVQDISEEGYGSNTVIQMQWIGKLYKSGLGWNWHRRQTTIHLSSDEKEPGESVTSSGPLFSFSYPASSVEEQGLAINLTGAVLWVDDRLRGSYRLPDLHMSVAYSF